MRRHAPIGRAALLAAMVCSLAGFGPCDSTRVIAPNPVPGSSAMSRSWPNEDGRTWDYAATYRETSGGILQIFPTAGEVPVVTMSDVDALLASAPDFAAVSGSDFPFRMRFEGEITTGSGVHTQNLLESFPPSMAPLHWSGEFLAGLALARPDLRARLGRYAPGLYPRPNFIHGYAFIKGPIWIGSYGDVDTILAWKFLDATLGVGHTFQHQLVPSLASDVFLRARVARLLSYAVPGAGLVRHCVEVRYLLDYGISTETNELGTFVGYFRRYDYGRVIYAPGIGPVLDEEHRLAFAGLPHDPGNYLLLLRLTSFAAGPGPIAAR